MIQSSVGEEDLLFHVPDAAKRSSSKMTEEREAGCSSSVEFLCYGRRAVSTEWPALKPGGHMQKVQ